MYLYTIPFTIETEHKIEPINIKIISYSVNNYLLIKYTQDKIYYNKIRLDTYTFDNIIQEYVNNSPLWDIKYSNCIKISANPRNYIYTYNFIIHINTYLIPEYIGKSLGLHNVLYHEYDSLILFNGQQFANKSYISYNDLTNPSDFKIQLYDYQKRNLNRMLSIENNIENNSEFKMEYTIKVNLDDYELLYDPILNKYSEIPKYIHIRSNGGIIADSVGLGKTFTTLSLISTNKSTSIEKIKNNLIISKATVVICPSHLAKQWHGEIKKCMPKAKVLIILTKISHQNLLFKDFVNADIIITSQQFLMNFKYYPALYFRGCSPSLYSWDRNAILSEALKKMISDYDYDKLLEFKQPIFEFFTFHRLVVDEGHEIFGEMLHSNSLSKYMSTWLLDFSAKYKWYVSGTPFINIRGLLNCGKFIGLELTDRDNDICINVDSKHIISTFIEKDFFWDRIFKNICIRHSKEDVSDQVQIPKYTEEVKWLELTDMERELYNINKTKKSSINLQKLCCHLLMISSTKKIFGDEVLDLSLIQDKLISYHKKNYDDYEKKIEELDKTNQAYYMVKKAYETQMRESKYLFTMLDKMKTINVKNEECIICLENINEPTLTPCGHLYCFECIKSCIILKSQCPMCKKSIKPTELLLVEKKVETKINLIDKYGSKLGCIINTVKEIIQNNNNRIIIFSQWDDMLNLVAHTLDENKINNVNVKGNAAMRNNAISKFKDGINQVIMLSLKNGASGTNLTEATHIIFIEPINASYNEVKLIEGQAIGRACRIGQKNDVKVLRILIKDTIEEEIYKNYKV